MTKGIAVLGSTGSVGRQALEVARHLDIPVRALSAAGSSVELLYEQVRAFAPDIVHVMSERAAIKLDARLRGDAAIMAARGGRRIEVLRGAAGLETAAARSGADTVVVAISGAAGLPAVLAAIRAGLRVALANKESLVMAGRLVTGLAREKGALLLPVDSEHSAILQCLAGDGARHVHRLVLTASGGPFREYDAKRLAAVTPEQAAAHPVWNMGRKISIDSATLMNKGLEVIEASWLFGMGPDAIDVAIHPQGVVHSMVEFADGVIIAQLGSPDMRTPIQYALTYPDRLAGLAPRVDLFGAAPLTFSAPDTARFPCLALAYDALRAGGTMPAVYNAANEEAVRLFVNREAGFTDIPALVRRAMERHSPAGDLSLDAILAADAEARRSVSQLSDYTHER